MTTWAHASSKLGAINPATRSKAKEIFDAAQKAGHDIWFMWGMGGGSEHGSGNALDLMVRNEAGGDFVRNTKQLIDLLRQFGDVAADPRTAAVCRSAADRLFRGVVEAGTSSAAAAES